MMDKMSVIVLAGGKSSRMGENKMLLPLGTNTVIGHLISVVKSIFSECIVVTDQAEHYRHFSVRTTTDLIACPVKNSLVGIHAGLSASNTPYNLVIAGDMPFVSPVLLKYLCAQSSGHDVTIPRELTYLQPLCAVYHKNCVRLITQQLEQGIYKISAFFSVINVNYVDIAELKPLDPGLLTFFNINTRAEYEKAVEIWSIRDSSRLVPVNAT